MSRVIRLAGLGILGVALMVSVGTSGDKKDKDKEPKVSLPPGWKALKLSKDQQAKVRGIMVEYKTKIDELNKKIDELKAAEKQEMLKVLTAEQRALYLKGLTGEDTTKDKASKDKDK
jgi:hypothetical protein